MSLWGTSPDAVDNKPKNLTAEEKRDVYATNKGWTASAGGNDNSAADREVLVAIGDLAGSSASTGLQEATVTSLRFTPGTTATTDHTAGGGATVTIEITWDEAVTITGSPVMKVVNSGGGTHDCVYTAAGSTANKKVFKVAGQTLATGNVLSLGTALHDAVTLPGGATIKDTASGTVNSQRNLAAAIRVTHTVLV
jgi:hypothetical protein|tara:strand:+ start:126 stop:710 length:585 start_codon:yes stop_codon:yes gene_type:complete